MAWIYDISKSTLINSSQIVTLNFKNDDFDLEITAMIAAGKGDSYYGGYGAPITYSILNKDLRSLVFEDIKKIREERIEQIQLKIKGLEKELAAEMKKKSSDINIKIPELRGEINSLDKECKKLQNDFSIEVQKIGTESKVKKAIVKFRQSIIERFTKQISNPEFHSSNEIIDFSKIL